jgi:hypothetical protein
MSYSALKSFIPETGCLYRVVVATLQKPLKIEFSSTNGYAYRYEIKNGYSNINQNPTYLCRIFPEELEVKYIVHRNGVHQIIKPEKNNTTNHYVESIFKIENET